MALTRNALYAPYSAGKTDSTADISELIKEKTYVFGKRDGTNEEVKAFKARKRPWLT